MKKFNFKVRGKDFSIEVKECRNILSKGTGLMFRKNSSPLLFIFNKPVKEAIHSFFCVPFMAIWFNKGKAIDIKYVEPWKIRIVPFGKFDRMLEVPKNDKNFRILYNLIK